MRVAFALLLTIGCAARIAAVPAAQALQPVVLQPAPSLTAASETVTLPGSPFTAQRQLPASGSRPPLVVIVSRTPAGDLAAALAAQGIASLQPAGTASIDTLAQWIAFARNDERFPTVTVFARGADVEAGVIAGRAARADGILTPALPPNAGVGPEQMELARVIAATGTVTATAAEGAAQEIAQFARKVPALGRRGGSAARPSTARRSLRHVLIASVGGARVGIEWGQPQKRERDVWGALVPWDAIWMPGADEATTLTTDAPITIGSLVVPAGDHTFYAFPTANDFNLIVSNDVGQFHTVRAPEKELGRVPMTLTTLPAGVEGVTFAIAPRGAGIALTLSWDTREYAAPMAPVR